MRKKTVDAENAELSKAEAAALRRFVGDVLTGKRKKAADPQSKTVTVRLKLHLDEQIKLGVLCERANESAGPYLSGHLRGTLDRLFDRMTDADRTKYLERLDKAVAAMKD